MKKFTKLYITLFLLSAMLTSMIIVTYASSTTGSTNVTYQAPPASELNHYELVIPATLSLEKTGGSMTIYVADGHQLEDDYEIFVELAPNQLIEQSPSPNKIDTFPLYLDGDTNSSYHIQYELKHSSGQTYQQSEYASQRRALQFRKTGTQSIYDGQIIFEKRDEYSKFKKNVDGGTFSNTLNFVVYGSYF